MLSAHQMAANISIKTFLRPTGMKNKGNTYFFNATMQCLLSVPSLVSFLRRHMFDNEKQGMLCALKDFIGSYNEEKVVDPVDFIRILKKGTKIFDGQQQDPHNFLDYLLNNIIEEEMKDKNKISKIKEMFEITNEDTIKSVTTANK